jgi:hypothetical protein
MSEASSLHSTTTLFTDTTITITITTTTTINMNGQSINFVPAGQATPAGVGFAPCRAPRPQAALAMHQHFFWDWYKYHGSCPNPTNCWFAWWGPRDDSLVPSPCENLVKIRDWINGLDVRHAAEIMDGFGGKIESCNIAGFKTRVLFLGLFLRVQWSPSWSIYIADQTQPLGVFQRHLRIIYGLEEAPPPPEGTHVAGREATPLVQAQGFWGNVTPPPVPSLGLPQGPQTAVPVHGLQNNMVAVGPEQVQRPPQAQLVRVARAKGGLDLVIADLFRGPQQSLLGLEAQGLPQQAQESVPLPLVKVKVAAPRSRRALRTTDKAKQTRISGHLRQFPS